MLAIGRNPTIEALRSDHQVNEILLQQQIRSDEKIAEIQRTAAQRNIKLTEIPKHQLDKISEGEPHQGVIAKTSFEVEHFDSSIPFDQTGMYIYIREAQYEHNVGAIIRTAEAAGLAGVIIPPKQEITPVVVRISMGAIFHIPIYTGSLFPTIKFFKKVDQKVTAIERNENTTIYDANLKANGLLIIGGEDRSISEEIQNKCDQVAQIPQFGQVNSLNMSVAAAITIYEHVRQKLQK